MSNIIAEAWDKVKGDDDAEYAAATPTLRAELADRAEAVRKTGVVTESEGEPSPFTEFESEYKKLWEKEKKGKAKKSDSK